jgi:hypothetical protein
MISFFFLLVVHAEGAELSLAIYTSEYARSAYKSPSRRIKLVTTASVRTALFRRPAMPSGLVRSGPVLDRCWTGAGPVRAMLTRAVGNEWFSKSKITLKIGAIGTGGKIFPPPPAAAVGGRSRYLYQPVEHTQERCEEDPYDYEGGFYCWPRSGSNQFAICE